MIMSKSCEENNFKDPDKSTSDSIQIVITKNQKQYPGFRKNLHDYVTEYTTNTGIHGFKYIGEQRRLIIEKIYWLFLCCISLYICVNLIIKTWNKWDQSPVLVSFAQSPTPVWQIPFPAITVCPQTKIKQREYNFTEYYHKAFDHILNKTTNITEEELEKFSDNSVLCDNQRFRRSKFTDIKFIHNLIEITPRFEEVFMACKFANLNETCGELFSPILTDDGVCFTFNMLDRSEFFTDEISLPTGYMEQGRKTDGWSLENGYSKGAGNNKFPRRNIIVGRQNGIFLLLRAFKQDFDYVCSGLVQGFKILLHNPAEIPRLESYHFLAPLNEDIMGTIQPNIITSSSRLRNYDPRRRQCFFVDERPLLFYKTYTQQNCQVECLANYSLARCGCVAYHMPHNATTKICGSGSTQCLFDARQELLIREVESDISGFEIEEDSKDLPRDCDCLPACISITYTADISQTDFHWPDIFHAYKADFNEFPGMQLTRLTLFFNEMRFISTQRNELYATIDFLANCGGLLGLFTGFSFLTIIEIIYFLTLRLMCNIYKYGIHYWSGSEKLINNDNYSGVTRDPQEPAARGGAARHGEPQRQ